MYLQDILPNINRNLDHGLIMENGACVDTNEKYADFIGTGPVDNLEELSFYFPAEVGELSEDSEIFLVYAVEFKDLIFTTNMERIRPELFKCSGFKHVYIIDPETEEVLFHSEKFHCAPHSLCDDELWNMFASAYEMDQFSAMEDPLFFDPDVNLDW